MSISEFRYNKKRKHYSYIFKKMGLKRKNILITSKPVMLEKKHKNNRIKTKMTINVVLFCHPNHSKKGQFYLIPRVYIDYVDSFDDVVLKKWHFDKADCNYVNYLNFVKNIAYYYFNYIYLIDVKKMKTDDYPKSVIYYDNFQYTDNVLFYGVDGLNVQYEGELSYLGDSYELSFDVVIPC